MTETTTKRRQVSLYLSDAELRRLDAWIAEQQEVRGYDVDRSHVVDVLLRRFNERNAPHLKAPMAPSSSERSRRLA